MSAPSKRLLPREKEGGTGHKKWKDGPVQEGQRFADRKLMGVSPNDEQFEPTEASPVPLHYKMAGGA